MFIIKRISVTMIRSQRIHSELSEFMDNPWPATYAVHLPEE